jgi:hypothetical protein
VRKKLSALLKKKFGKEYYRKHSKKYYQKNKERYNKRSRELYQINKNKIREQHREYTRLQRKNNINYNVGINLRMCILYGIKKGKNTKATELLGCSNDYFRRYFKSKFTKGMTWEKFMAGKIHMNYIVPCAAFDLSKEEEQKKCFHYTNIQPLWAK